MKKIILILLSATLLNARAYFARVEPIEIYHIKSSVNVPVIDINRELEGRDGGGRVVLHLDDRVELFDLNQTKKKISILDESISILKDMIDESKNSLKIAWDAYKRVKNLQSYTKVQKDSKRLVYINAKKALLSQKSNLENLLSSKADLLSKKSHLEDSIEKRRVLAKSGEFVYKIYPNRGDFVNMGSPLVDLYDLSRARLTIFVPIDEIDSIKDKNIYIDDKKTNYKIDKIWRVADTKEISSYRVEIIIDGVKEFSKLLKVEFK